MKIITRANSSEDSPIYALAEKVLRDRKEQADKDAVKASEQAKEITAAMQQKPAATLAATPAVKTEQTPAAKPPVVLTREAGASEAKPTPTASTDKK